MKWKQKKYRLDRDGERILKRLTDENGLSESQIINLLLIEKDEQTRPLSPEQKELQRDIDQLEARKRALGPYEQSQYLDLTSSENRAKQQRSDHHLTHKANPQQIEQERIEAQAKAMLGAGSKFYDVEKATGLSRSEVTQLELQRRAEDEAKTKAALAERDEALNQAMGTYGHTDPLAERIRELRQEDEYQPSGLNELNVEALQRYMY